jgi:hypothetical protein
MKRLKYLLAIFGIVFGVGSVLSPSTAGAINVFPSACDGNSTSQVCKSTGDSLSTFIQTVVNTLLFVIGSVAVMTIIIAGIRYITSHGDSGAVEIAKNTLFYAIIGLVVAISAYAIVNFVVFKFFVK